MTETFFEKLILERQFAGVLQTHAEVFFRLSNSLLEASREGWNKKHYFQLISESDALESFLDDHGARFNRTYAFLTELVASVRWFAHAGYSIAHLLSRLESYGAVTSSEEWSEAQRSISAGLAFLQTNAVELINAARKEAKELGVELTPETFPESNFMPVVAKRKLPRNAGQAELVHEEQKIAEVVTKYLQGCEMLRELGVRRIEDPKERHAFFARVCTEELARVYEATVHNLQSTYDTHIQNTVLEARDKRLAQLRGHVSAALHVLEAVTYLAHFIERHETDIRSEEAKRRISDLVDRSDVERVALNVFLFLADRFLQSGASIAEELLPEYTNLLELEVDLPDHLSLHARPAALIVGIVNHYATPVEMEINGKRCNAGSILELLVTVGSQPHQRRLIFRGDERPVRDIGRLFENELGENGMDALPVELSYLRVQ